MTIDSHLAWVRGRLQAQMTQRSNVWRPVGEVTYDPGTGSAVQPVIPVGAGLPCKVTSNGREGVDVTAGETEIRLIDHVIKFPVGTPVQIDDLVELIEGEFNPIDVDRDYRITDIDRREWQPARICVIEEVNVPRLWIEES